MAIASPRPEGWLLSLVLVGPLPSLFERLRAMSADGQVALGVDFPIGLPRAYVQQHVCGIADFPAFLRTLTARPEFFVVADVVSEVSAGRPFYPRRGVRGMTRLSHALALGLTSAAGLSRVCDRATVDRPAGAPLFWTLGANQSGKAAISAWRDLLLPAFAAEEAIALWPFDGPLRQLLGPGRIVIAETYPAEALRQLGLRLNGSKRRQSDRLLLVSALRSVMQALNAEPSPELGVWLSAGFGHDPCGEDRLDCLLGLLCMLKVLAGRCPDYAPADPWIQSWEGWVLGQAG